MAEDEARFWEAVRDDFSCTRTQAYLNTGTLGPMPQPVLAQYIEHIQEWNSAGPGNPLIYGRWHRRTERVREHLARWFSVGPESLALTGNVTDAINIGLMGLDLPPGSRVVTSDEEHGALVAPLGVLAQHGVTVDIVPYGDGGPDLLQRIDEALASPCQLVVLSHVSCDTGAFVDGEALAKMAHARGALVMLDGAQSAGQMALDLGAMGVDLYGINGHKWLLGPVGTGALYVAPSVRDRVAVRLAGSDSGWHSDYPTSVRSWWVPEATRYEYGTRPWAAFAAWDDMLHYWDRIGPERAMARQRLLALALRRELAQVPGIRFRSLEVPVTGITAFQLEGWHNEELATALRFHHVVGRRIRESVIDGVRLSTSFFNNAEDVAKAVAAVRTLADQGVERMRREHPEAFEEDWG